jgi:hypothetical protein
LTDINVDDCNSTYSSENGVLFNKDKTTIIMCPSGKTGSYAIPYSATTLGSRAFFCCSKLTSVTIPNSVTKIDKLAFSGCSKLTIINLNPVPQDITHNVFGIVYSISSCTLKVPASAIDAYKGASVWLEFGNIVAIE